MASVTVTENDIVEEGFTVIAAVVSPALLHEYVPPPVAVKVVLLPLHHFYATDIRYRGRKFVLAVLILLQLLAG